CSPSTDPATFSTCSSSSSSSILTSLISLCSMEECSDSSKTTLGIFGVVCASLACPELVSSCNGSSLWRILALFLVGSTLVCLVLLFRLVMTVGVVGTADVALADCALVCLLFDSGDIDIATGGAFLA